MQTSGSAGVVGGASSSSSAVTTAMTTAMGGESAAIGAPRRPLIVSQENRSMLLNICDSLNHLQTTENNNMQQLRADLSQSTPNLLDKNNGGGPPSSSASQSSQKTTSARLMYNKHALHEITQSLEKVKLPDKYSVNGYAQDTEIAVQQLTRLGYPEVSSSCTVNMKRTYLHLISRDHEHNLNQLSLLNEHE